MKSIASLVVNQRKFVLCLFIIFATISALFIGKVEINSDMSKYLPDDSETKIGKTIMESEFPASTSLNMMIEGISTETGDEILEYLESYSQISDVQLTSTEKNEKDYFLYAITFNDSSSSDSVKNALTSIKSTFEDDTVWYSGDALGSNMETVNLPLIAGIAFIILLIILFIMCESWIEPLLFLFTIMIAVFLNMGTNVIFDSISDITSSIAAILQVVLCMDYSIMLLNRYRQEKKKIKDTDLAMKSALVHGFRSISSSSVTTIVGMLMLVFMSFTIGKDLGLVLAKGVFISLLCIFTVLPALILEFDNLIERTSKKPLYFHMEFLGRLQYKGRYVIAILFVILFGLSFFLRGNINIGYTTSAFDKIYDIFTPSNPIVVLYKTEEEDQISEVLDWASDQSTISEIQSYQTTVGAPLTFDAFGETFGIDADYSALLYDSYLRASSNYTESKIPLYDLLQFMQTDLLNDPLASEFMQVQDFSQFGELLAGLSSDMMMSNISSQEFSQMTQLDLSICEIIFDYYDISQGIYPDQTIALYDMILYMNGSSFQDSVFSGYFTEEIQSQLSEALVQIEFARSQFIQDNYSRIILETTLPEESDQTSLFLADLDDTLSTNLNGDYYLLGNSAMAGEMSESFPSELNFITILTAFAIFLVVLLAFRSFSVSLLLVCIIQCAVFITMGTLSLQGDTIYYLPLLIVQCILMGATIDYGILYANYYKEARLVYNIKEAITEALHHAIHTIMTSAMILFFVTLLLGLAMKNSNVATSEILMTIAKGSLVSTLLVLFVLPGLLAALDRFIIRKK